MGIIDMTVRVSDIIELVSSLNKFHNAYFRFELIFDVTVNQDNINDLPKLFELCDKRGYNVVITLKEHLSATYEYRIIKIKVTNHLEV